MEREAEKDHVQKVIEESLSHRKPNLKDRVLGVIKRVTSAVESRRNRLGFFRDPMNWFDSSIVLLWLVDALFASFVSLPIDSTLPRLARLARLLRLVKLIEKMRGVDQLVLMTTALKSSMMVLLWTVLFLFTCLVFWALLCNQVLVTYYLEDCNERHCSGQDLERRQETFKYFGTFTRSMFSMFEITLGGWVSIARNLFDNVSPWFLLVSLLHKFTMGFAVIGVINGIFFQETFKVAAGDDRIMVMRQERQAETHRKKMKELFSKTDRDNGGTVVFKEFKKICEDKFMQTWLAAQEIPTNEPFNLFELLSSGEQRLTEDDFVKATSRLSGSARNSDIEMLLRDQKNCLELVKMLIDLISVAGSGEKAVVMTQTHKDLENSMHEGCKTECGTTANQDPASQGTRENSDANGLTLPCTPMEEPATSQMGGSCFVEGCALTAKQKTLEPLQPPKSSKPAPPSGEFTPVMKMEPEFTPVMKMEPE